MHALRNASVKKINQNSCLVVSQCCMASYLASLVETRVRGKSEICYEKRSLVSPVSPRVRVVTTSSGKLAEQI